MLNKTSQIIQLNRKKNYVSTNTKQSNNFQSRKKTLQNYSYWKKRQSKVLLEENCDEQNTSTISTVRSPKYSNKPKGIMHVRSKQKKAERDVPVVKEFVWEIVPDSARSPQSSVSPKRYVPVSGEKKSSWTQKTSQLQKFNSLKCQNKTSSRKNRNKGTKNHHS